MTETTTQKNRRVTSIDFVFDDKKEYIASINESRILLVKSDKTLVAEFNLSTGKNEWYLSHCCGAQGFGREASDVCYACSTPNSKLEEKKENLPTLMVYSGFKKELSDFVAKELPVYFSKINNVFN